MGTKSPLHKAVELLGGQRPLAAAIGVPTTTLAYWLTGSRKGVPAEYAAAIEQATGRAVLKEQLRPDIFGPHGPTELAGNDAGGASGSGHSV